MELESSKVNFKIEINIREFKEYLTGSFGDNYIDSLDSKEKIAEEVEWLVKANLSKLLMVYLAND